MRAELHHDIGGVGLAEAMVVFYDVLCPFGSELHYLYLAVDLPQSEIYLLDVAAFDMAVLILHVDHLDGSRAGRDVSMLNEFVYLGEAAFAELPAQLIAFVIGFVFGGLLALVDDCRTGLLHSALKIINV